MKASMSNFDINAIISELIQRCSKSELKNIFELKREDALETLLK